MCAVYTDVERYDCRVKMAERLACTANVSAACLGIVDLSSRRLVDVWVGQGKTGSALPLSDTADLVSDKVKTFLSQKQDRPVRRAAKGASETWLRSHRYLIGIGAQVGNFAPMAAFVNGAVGSASRPELQSLARIGLTFAEQLRNERAGADPAEGLNGLQAQIPDIILRSLSFGVAVSDAAGELRYMTSLAETWLAENDELHVAHDRLAAGLPQNQKALQAALSAAAATPGQVSVVQLGGAEALPKTVIVLPFSQSPGLALVVFGHTQGDRALRDLMLETLGLTVAERQLAKQLLAGKSLAAAAEENNLTISTARSYLKRIFAKTGSHRQSQFITLYHQLMPPLRVGSQDTAEKAPY
ncbi:helix-turn-helix transcriptional regulator [Ruegeria hyattellae]|uniref:helix-turn-helix transcriptional regulator n=1 Tax=Ruegeria hyattellae TaxID=3233337 RepID=UPI00355B815A